MPTIDEKRKAVLEQALRDMSNYGVKLRKPEDLPDFDQPVDHEAEKKKFEPVSIGGTKRNGEPRGFLPNIISRYRIVLNGKGCFC